MYGGKGNDFMFGAGGDDIMLGEDGNDQLKGGDGNDKLYGNAGVDWLWGEYGDDYLDGGAESLSDFLYGGKGKDKFKTELKGFSVIKNIDKAWDENLAEGDTYV